MSDLDLSDLFRLDDRVAIVTGASSGLGDRFARVLHAAGARVVLAARRADRLEALAADLPGSIAVPTDVSVEADLERLVATAMDAHGRIDVLVNNAGVSDPMRAEEETVEHYRWVMDVNVDSVYRLSQLAARPMLEAGRGSIVNVSSILGLVASTPINEASYVASKHAVVGLTRQLGSEWVRRGVRVNALAPGWFRTEMAEVMFTDPGSVRFVERNTPIGRGGEPHELDGALLFLASDASAYVTGHTLPVDGGWTAR
ncbi:SDR family NAD(P)-dependent oxidoreductase [Rhabdothermincola salaria]|uniref:SDR family NAD(P)-dependent oxidoreductase n=1 Tax=Rhabdothermincola salaria TaxID=2903142 RepID=UPI001E4F2983|nr:glucose 1-dehydrogenase [Rhabdothermincola salaria]